MREKIFRSVEYAIEDDKLSTIYNFFMMFVIICSLLPLMFKEQTLQLLIIDKAAAVIFIIEYLFRLTTADLKLKKGKLSFFIYTLTPMAIVDLLCILPSLTLFNIAFRLLKLFRLFQTLRIFRVFKFVRYSRSKRILLNAFRRQRKALAMVLFIAFGYIVVAAMIEFNVEPHMFDNFFEAIYWATVSLTTMGYGDITPVTGVGRLVTVVSAMFGIAMIALPSGIITAGIMSELNEEKNYSE